MDKKVSIDRQIFTDYILQCLSASSGLCKSNGTFGVNKHLLVLSHRKVPIGTLAVPLNTVCLHFIRHLTHKQGKEITNGDRKKNSLEQKYQLSHTEPRVLNRPQ